MAVRHLLALLEAFVVQIKAHSVSVLCSKTPLIVCFNALEFSLPIQSWFLAKQLCWSECPCPHLPRHGIEQTLFVDAAPEARLVQLSSEYCLATSLQLAEREPLGEETKRQFEPVDVAARGISRDPNQVCVIEGELSVF